MRIVSTIGLLLLLCSPAWANKAGYVATTLGLHLGYGDDRQSDRWHQVSVSGKWRWQNWRFKAGTGWLGYQGGEQGISDSWTSASYLFQQPLLSHWWDARLRIKLPTADAKKSLGTGSTDTGIRLQALKQVDKLLLWYYLGYRQRGHSDEFKLQNSWRWGAGVRLSRFSLFYDGYQASQPGFDKRHSLTLMTRVRWAEKNVSPYLSAQQDGDWSAGVSLKF